MTRWKASAIHLGLSGATIAAVTLAASEIWYSDGLLEFAEGLRLVALVAGIDLVVGPLITLIIYRQGKPGLKFDLTAIASLQAAFLAFGLSTLWQTRPAYVVAIPERLILVFAHEVRHLEHPDAPPPRPDSPPRFGPEVVSTRLPESYDLRQHLLDRMLAGDDLPVFPQFYLPFATLSDSLLQESNALESIGPGLDAADRAALITSLRQSWGGDIRWTPITSSRGTGTAIIDGSSGVPLRFLSLDPIGGR